MAAKKQMSKAFKTAQDYRDMVNKGRVRILAKDFSCVVYLYDNVHGKPCAIGYRGRAKNPAFNYRYSSTEARQKCVTEWIEAQMNRVVRRKPDPRKLQVGDVLRASWGYDQTNIDYYMVTQLIGASMVELVEIGQLREMTGDMQGDCVPDKSKVIGKPMRRRADGEAVRIDSVRHAFKVESKKVGGVEVFSPDRWTAYH